MVSVFRFLLLVFLCSCSVGEEDPTSNFGGFYQVQGQGYRFTLDSGRFQRMDFNRRDPSVCQVNFEIKKIVRSGNELTLEIARPKGCSAVYELVWDGKWQESAPRRMQVYLTGLFDSCSPGNEIERETIKVDLAKALRDSPTDLFTIYVREHCSFRDFNCVGNCNLIISD